MKSAASPDCLKTGPLPNLDRAAYNAYLPVRFLVMAYVVLLVTGLLGNMVIIWSVLWHHSMRTARNVFIMTLAISDLILCLFTMPTTLWEVRRREN